VSERQRQTSLRLYNNVPDVKNPLDPILTVDELAGPGLQGKALRRFWARVFEKGKSTLESTEEERTLAAWRIVRHLAQLRGAIQEHCGIEDALKEGPDVFYTPFTALAVFQDGYIRAILEEVQLPLLPPRVPNRHLELDGTVQETYDPYKDPALSKFRDMVEYAGRKLGLHHSKIASTGFAWLVQHETIRAAFPPLDQLIAFERRLANNAMQLMVQKDYNKAFQELQDDHEFSIDEALTVMRMARALAHAYVDADDIKGIKAMVLLRLQVHAQAAAEAYDHRGAAMIEREMWKVARDQGTAEEIDELEDMASVVRINAANKRKELPEA
jgi:hypothetical protein